MDTSISICPTPVAGNRLTRHTLLALLIGLFAIGAVFVGQTDHAFAQEDEVQVSCQRGQSVIGLLSWGGPGSVLAFAEGIDFVTFDEVTVWGGSSCDNPICAATFYEAGNPDIAWEIVGAYSDDWVSWSYAECSGSPSSGVSTPQAIEGPTPPRLTLR